MGMHGHFTSTTKPNTGVSERDFLDSPEPLSGLDTSPLPPDDTPSAGAHCTTGSSKGADEGRVDRALRRVRRYGQEGPPQEARGRRMEGGEEAGAAKLFNRCACRQRQTRRRRRPRRRRVSQLRRRLEKAEAARDKMQAVRLRQSVGGWRLDDEAWERLLKQRAEVDADSA